MLIVCTFAACERREIEKAKEAVLEQSAKFNHESILIARSEVRRLWAVEGDVWYGKLADGTVLRLDSPRVESRTKNEGRKPFCRRSGEITVTATRWKSNPPTDTSAPISVTYSILMQDSKRMGDRSIGRHRSRAPDARRDCRVPQGLRPLINGNRNRNP